MTYADSLTHQGPAPEVAATEASALTSDPVQVLFDALIRRSRTTMSSAQRSPVALLFAGTVVAGVGLIFFMITLPNLATETVWTSRLDSTAVPDLPSPTSTPELWPTLLNLIPRLLMLLFIQLLAGFFLRQYRASMEEFRYFESVLRFRESQLLAYLMRKSTDDKKAISELSKAILVHKDFSLIGKSVKSRILDTHLRESNEFKELLFSLERLLRSKGIDSGESKAAKTADD